MRIAPRRAWQQSIVWRTVVVTVLLTTIVLALVSAAMLQRVAGGLLEAKDRSSVAEAAAGVAQAVALVGAADETGTAAGAERLVDAVVRNLAQRAGSPPLYEIVLVQMPGAAAPGPERATNLVSTASIPAALLESAERSAGLNWTYTTVQYLDGASAPGLAVASALAVPGAGEYQLVYLFPYDELERTVGLIRSAALVAGLALLVLIGAIAWVVVRQVALPIRVADRAAARLAAGDLDQRLPVSGQDEVARLAASFNAMAANLQEQIGRLEELSRVQQRFVADVSHELRTPMTTIRMASDMLHDRRADLDPDSRRAVELLETQVDRFDRLLADLLEISGIDAGAVRLEAEPSDLRALVLDAVAALAPVAKDRRCEVQVRARGEDFEVVADPRRLRRIVGNLLANAVEYGPGRPVEVQVVAAPHAVSIAVRDHGGGLDQAQAQRVFDRFWRADPSRARTLGGTGLGLSIAREDALLHGGRIDVATQLGAGCQFVVTVPRRPGGGVLPPPVEATVVPHA